MIKTNFLYQAYNKSFIYGIEMHNLYIYESLKQLNNVSLNLLYISECFFY